MDNSSDARGCREELLVKLKPIQEQVVVVVGANSGIGRETALQFAERGYLLLSQRK